MVRTRTCRDAAALTTAPVSTIAVVSVGEPGCMPTVLPRLAAAGASAPLVLSATDSDPALTRRWAGRAPLRTRTGTTTSFARVVPPADYQGSAAATFAVRNLFRRRCAVLDDGTLPGKATAQRFVTTAATRGLAVRRARWSRTATGNLAVFRSLRAWAPDCVYLAGSASHNGIAVLRDKVAVLGNNAKVSVISGSGFASRTAVRRLGAAQGMYLVLGHVTAESAFYEQQAGVDFLVAYRRSHGALSSVAAVYTAVAMEAVTAAVLASDGTRAGVRRALFTAPGVATEGSASLFGVRVAIEPASGDVLAPWTSAKRLWGGRETDFHTVHG